MHRRNLGFILLVIALSLLSVTTALTATFVDNRTPSETPAWLDPGWLFWAQSNTQPGEGVCIEVHPQGDPGNYERIACTWDDTNGPIDSNFRCEVFTTGIPQAFGEATVEYQFFNVSAYGDCDSTRTNFTGFNWSFGTGPNAVTLTALTVKSSRVVVAGIGMALIGMSWVLLLKKWSKKQ